MKSFFGAMVLGMVFLVSATGCATRPPAAALRCCKFTTVISGTPVVKYYCLSACPVHPDFKDLGQCPPCPP